MTCGDAVAGVEVSDCDETLEERLRQSLRVLPAAFRIRQGERFQGWVSKYCAACWAEVRQQVDELLNPAKAPNV